MIVAAPAAAAQAAALELAAPGGRINFFAGLPRDGSRVELDTNLIHYKELLVTGTTACTTDDCREALELVLSGAVDTGAARHRPAAAGRGGRRPRRRALGRAAEGGGRAVIDATVLVTARSFALGRALEGAVREVRYNDLGRPLAAGELRARLNGVDGVLAGLDDVDASVLATPGLRVVARHGVGVDRVDLAAAERHGVTVTNTPGANAAAVAELTVALMLLLCRPVRRAERAVRAGEWPVLSGSELGQRTVGLLGAGHVGSRVARALAGLGCAVLTHDPARADSLPLDELLPRAEVLSLHAPLTAETSGLVER